MKRCWLLQTLCPGHWKSSSQLLCPPTPSYLWSLNIIVSRQSPVHLSVFIFVQVRNTQWESSDVIIATDEEWIFLYNKSCYQSFHFTLYHNRYYTYTYIGNIFLSLYAPTHLSQQKIITQSQRDKKRRENFIGVFKTRLEYCMVMMTGMFSVFTPRSNPRDPGFLRCLDQKISIVMDSNWVRHWIRSSIRHSTI